MVSSIGGRVLGVRGALAMTRFLYPSRASGLTLKHAVTADTVLAARVQADLGTASRNARPGVRI